MDSFLTKLAAANKSRVERWHGPVGVISWEPEMWACAAAGEMGEYCNVIKKLKRHKDGLQQKGVYIDHTHSAIHQNLIKDAAMEIGDIVVYLDLNAQRLGLTLEECIRSTFNRISIRENFPERL